MPAETHSRHDPLEVGGVIALVWSVLGEPGDPPDPGAMLSDLGIDTDLELLDLFDAFAEEYGERSLADVDLDDLQTLATIDDLAVAMIAWVSETDAVTQP
jgi:hypothetical protein